MKTRDKWLAVAGSIAVYVVILLTVFALSGCTTLTEAEIEEREYSRQIDLENWQLCEQAYEQAGLPTLHKGHTHSRGVGRVRHEVEAVRSDLLVNNCRRILGQYWIHK